MNEIHPSDSGQCCQARTILMGPCSYRSHMYYSAALKCLLQVLFLDLQKVNADSKDEKSHFSNIFSDHQMGKTAADVALHHLKFAVADPHLHRKPHYSIKWHFQHYHQAVIA